MSEQRPEDVYEQIHGGKNLPARRSTRLTTKTSERLDDSVKTVEERVKYWQEIANNWRIAIMQNEQIIIVFCILFGVGYSYAINECTGNINFPLYAYVMVGIILTLSAFLLIAEGSLPLVVLMKFIVSIALGHVSIMFMIAVDGHTWQAFTTDICRYPLTTDSIMVFIVGGGAGYIFKSFEEIKAGK